MWGHLAGRQALLLPRSKRGQSAVNSTAVSFAVLGMLFALVLLSGSVLIWVASDSGAQLTPAESTLVQVADWTVKTAVGAIVGFAGGAGLARRNGAASV